MRVLLVGKGAPEPGGIPAFLAQMQNGPLADLVELDFLNLAETDDRRAGTLSFTNVRHTVRHASALWRCAGTYEVVHIHTAGAPTVTFLRFGLLCVVARVRRAAVAAHIHGGLVEQWLRTRRRRALVRAVLALAARIMVPAGGTKAVLATAVARDRITVIPNGVETDRFTPSAEAVDPPVILFAGVLSPRKGLLELFTAARGLADAGHRFELVLVGDNHEEGEGEAAQVRAAGAGVATFLGARPHDEMPDLYRQASIFCLPSWFEALPISVLEAMASGLPVVASDVGDVATVVENGVTGFIVPPRDSDQLRRALEGLLLDRTERCTMGQAGRERAEQRFSAHVVAAAVAQEYAGIGRVAA